MGIVRAVIVAAFLAALGSVSVAADVRREVDDAAIARSSAALFRAFADASLANGDRAAAKSWRDSAAEGERTAALIERTPSTSTSGSAGPRREDMRVSDARKRAIAYARDLAALLLAKAAALEDEERAAHPADYDFQSRGGTTPR